MGSVDDRIRLLISSDPKGQEKFLLNGGWSLLHEWILQSRSGQNSTFFRLIISLLAGLPSTSVLAMLKRSNTPIIPLLESIVREKGPESEQCEDQRLCARILMQWYALIEQTAKEEDKEGMELTDSPVTVVCVDEEITLQPTKGKKWWVMTRNGKRSFVKMKEEYVSKIIKPSDNDNDCPPPPIATKQKIPNDSQKTLDEENPKNASLTELIINLTKPTKRTEEKNEHLKTYSFLRNEEMTTLVFKRKKISGKLENEDVASDHVPSLPSTKNVPEPKKDPEKPTATTNKTMKEEDDDVIILEEEDHIPWKLWTISYFDENSSKRYSRFNSQEKEIQRKREQRITETRLLQSEQFPSEDSPAEPEFDSARRPTRPITAPMVIIPIDDDIWKQTNVWDHTKKSWPDSTPGNKVVVVNLFHFNKPKKLIEEVDLTLSPPQLNDEPEKARNVPNYAHVRLPNTSVLPHPNSSPVPAHYHPTAVWPPLPKDDPPSIVPPPPPPPPPPTRLEMNPSPPSSGISFARPGLLPPPVPFMPSMFQQPGPQFNRFSYPNATSTPLFNFWNLPPPPPWQQNPFVLNAQRFPDCGSWNFF